MRYKLSLERRFHMRLECQKARPKWKQGHRAEVDKRGKVCENELRLYNILELRLTNYDFVRRYCLHGPG